tara:strand:+ start:583 stop:2196 length:1614 start_codon:yes stop_codon:yes gene_type:complete
VEARAALYGLKRKRGRKGGKGGRGDQEEQEETASSLAYAVVIHQRARGLADPYKAEGYEAYTWGVGCYGQLGHGKVTPYEYLSEPTLVNSLVSKPLTSVQCGGQHTLFSTSEGEVYACGNHGSGQLGIGEVKRMNTALPSSVGANDGSDEEEEEEEEYPYTFPDALSTRKKQSVPIPRLIESLPKSNAAATGTMEWVLSAGHEHTILFARGREIRHLNGGGSGNITNAYSFGYGGGGRLGHRGCSALDRPDNEAVAVKRPRLLKTVGSEKAMLVSSAATGLEHSALVDAEGALYTFGTTSEGRLGYTGCLTEQITPKRVLDGVLSQKRVVQVALAAKCSLALTSEGEVYSFGYGPLGELGLGRLVREGGEEEEEEEEEEGQQHWHFNSAVTHPVKCVVPGGHRIVQVAAAPTHSVLLTLGGLVFTCGQGVMGQLGHNSPGDQFTPRCVEALADRRAVQIAAGAVQTMVLFEDGSFASLGMSQWGVTATSLKEGLLHSPDVVTLKGRRVVQLSAGCAFAAALVERCHQGQPSLEAAGA